MQLTNENESEWIRLADLSDEQIGPREEDVKFKIVVPMLRLLGFTDFDFSFETPADLGRIDITVKGYPVGVVVECKGVNVRLDGYVSQVEKYVRETMTRKHMAMLSMLTNGRVFVTFGILDAIHKGELSHHALLKFRRADLKAKDTQNRLSALLSRHVVEGDPGYVRATIESALRARHDDEETRNALESQSAKLLEQMCELDQQRSALESQHAKVLEQMRELDRKSDGIISAVTPGLGATEIAAINGNSSFKWSVEYGTQDDVCAWINDLLERLASQNPRESVSHETLTNELCAFLSGRGTDRTKALTKEQRSKIAGNMIDWITANWTSYLGGKDSDQMRADPGASVRSNDAPQWLRQFTQVWTRTKGKKYAFLRR